MHSLTLGLGVLLQNIGAESGVYMNGTAFGGSALAHLARKLRVPSGVSPKEGLARRFLQTRGRRMTYAPIAHCLSPHEVLTLMPPPHTPRQPEFCCLTRWIT